MVKKQKTKQVTTQPEKQGAYYWSEYGVWADTKKEAEEKANIIKKQNG